MVEQTLTATLGTWSGSQPLTVGLEWLRCDAQGEGCQGLGITAGTYTLGAVDIGKTMRVKVTAANLAGARAALSDPTAVVDSLKPTEQNASIAAAKVTAPHKLVIDQVKIPARFTGRAMRVTLRVTDTRGFVVAGALVTATTLPATALTPPAEFTTAADGLVTLEFKRGAKLRAAIKVVTVVVIARRPGDKLSSPRGAIVRLKLPVAVTARR
jgi:acetolactate synthase regulatory subunit